MKQRIEIQSEILTADTVARVDSLKVTDIGRRVFWISLVDEYDIGFLLHKEFNYEDAIIFAEEERYDIDTGENLDIIDRVGEGEAA